MTESQLELARQRTDLFARIDKNGPIVRAELGPCWLWTGARNDLGYGHAKVAGTDIYIHRLVVMLDVGVLGEGVEVLHRCDNPPCCRREHLLVGTRDENVADAVQKGRVARAERLPQTKLSEEKVRAILAGLKDGRRGIDLAAEYGVTQQTVCDIKHRRKWMWVTA